MDASHARVFFALWPPPDVARAIAERAAALPMAGRRIAADRLHLTLAFHGLRDTSSINRLTQHADDIWVPAFTITLDRIGCFRRPGIVWFGPSMVPSALADLAAALTPAKGIEKSKFRPHVTVARRSTGVGPGRIAPVRWHVDRFRLVASGQNGVPGAYRTLAQWPLGAQYVASVRL